MLVDASYLAWVRPARRVHLALSVGMITTGVILATFGILGSRSAVPAAPSMDRYGDSSTVGNGCVPVMPVVPAVPGTAPAVAPPRLRPPIDIAPAPKR
jgi:hypothetical protein